MPRILDALARLVPRWPKEPAETKASRVGPLVAFETLGRPVWAPRDYAAFAREGFMQNAIVYRSVRMIAEAAASVPLLLYEGPREVEEHPFLDLLRKPSADHTGTDFLEAWYGYLLVSGNAYAEAVAIGGEVRELFMLRPDRMKVIPGAAGWPEGYEYTAGGESIRFTEDAVPGVRPILHMRLFHPANDHYGMSPIEAAATAIDIHNAASQWNKALLDNSARPSGALVYAAGGGHMTSGQFERLKSELETSYTGAKQAGRPLLLEGGLDWKPLSLTPKDMDFIEAKNTAAREIALALGVPPMLLGIPGDNTYSNYQEAQRAFWRQTVLPLVTRTAGALSSWLAPCFAPGDSPVESRPPGALDLRPDLDQIEALAPEREALWARMERTTFLTANEKRAAVGYDPLEEGGSQGPFEPAPHGSPLQPALKYSPDQPRVPSGNSDGGQWTNGGGDGGSVSSDSSTTASDRRVLSDATPDDFSKPGTQLAQAGDSERYRVRLQEQDTELGGHTIRDHVGKSDAELVEEVRRNTVQGVVINVGHEAEGTFLSADAANDFVNQALNLNRDTVDAVGRGELSEAVFTTRFGYVTGKEAFRPDADAEPYIRPTYAVRIVLRHDPRLSLGFKVLTAFPVNQRSNGEKRR